jgi:sarcosine oxidase subunit beta
MKKEAQIVIVGGWVIGLSIAHQLAKMGINDVVVLESKYILYGASGRNGGGVRAQWGTKDNILLAKESVKAFKKMSGELGINIWFRQGGYLFLTADERKMRMLESYVKLQNSLGVKSRTVTREEAKKIAPVLDTRGFIGGTFCKQDGVLYPFPVVWGLYDNVKKKGIDVHDFTPVERIEVQGGKVRGVVTPKGTIRTSMVVNAAGGYSRKVSEMVNLEVPNYPVRHEIMVTESLKPFLNPLVACLDTGLYFNQTMRGEIIGGLPTHEEPDLEISSSLEFLKRMAKELLRMMPRLRSTKVLRQWAGLYDMTPDGKPLLGKVDEVEGFVLACGLCGHGFMLAPSISRLVAEEIAGRKTFMPIDQYHLARFRKGEIKKEEMILG